MLNSNCHLNLISEKDYSFNSYCKRGESINIKAFTHVIKVIGSIKVSRAKNLYILFDCLVAENHLTEFLVYLIEKIKIRRYSYCAYATTLMNLEKNL